jgi:hypothetical protein
MAQDDSRYSTMHVDERLLTLHPPLPGIVVPGPSVPSGSNDRSDSSGSRAAHARSHRSREAQ